jgi:hypothetical protein
MSDLKDVWDRFYAALDAGRATVEATDRFRDDPRWRAQAYTNLLEAQAMAYQVAVVPRRTLEHPRVYWCGGWYDNACALGQPIQDFRYGVLCLDGRRSYRLSGRIGDAKLLLSQVHSHIWGDPRQEEIGNYDYHDFQLGPDGSFEIVVSAERHPGNWIAIAAESNCNFVLVRAIMGDWNDELPSLSIQADGPPPTPEDPDTAACEAVVAATHFFTYLVEVYMVGLYDIYLDRAGGQKNDWAKMPGTEVTTALIGSRTTTYVPGVYQLAADEAIIIEWTPPDSDYWSAQVGDVWSRPLDFVNHQTDINMVRAAIDADGKFRAVVAVDDPGYANWLDPCGNLEGTIVMRNYRSRSETVEPTLVTVKTAQLAGHLPGSPTVSPDERRKALEYRRSATQSFFLR